MDKKYDNPRNRKMKVEIEKGKNIETLDVDQNAMIEEKVLDSIELDSINGGVTPLLPPRP